MKIEKTKINLIYNFKNFFFLFLLFDFEIFDLEIFDLKIFYLNIFDLKNWYILKFKFFHFIISIIFFFKITFVSNDFL